MYYEIIKEFHNLYVKNYSFSNMNDFQAFRIKYLNFIRNVFSIKSEFFRLFK